MSVEVILNIYVDPETAIDVYEIAANIDKYHSGLIDSGPHVGFILTSSPRSPDKYLEIIDDVEPLTQRLCFRAVADLVVYKSVTVSFFTHLQRLKLDAKNELVYISGDFGPTTFLRTELLPPLYYCGQKYIDLLNGLAKYKPYYETPKTELKTHAEATRIALKKAKLIRM